MTYTIREAAKIIGVRVRTIRWWIKTGKICAEKDKDNGWYWQIPEEEVARYANKNREHS